MTKVRENHGRERTGKGVTRGNADMRDLVCAIVGLSNACGESARAGGDVWYELEVYVHRSGIRYQVQKHGSVVGGQLPPPAWELGYTWVAVFKLTFK